MSATSIRHGAQRCPSMLFPKPVAAPDQLRERFFQGWLCPRMAASRLVSHNNERQAILLQMSGHFAARKLGSRDVVGADRGHTSARSRDRAKELRHCELPPA
jgi:hypothetical protein